jgi:UDP-glucose 4-epimerase
LDQLFAEKINSSYEVINVGLGKGYTVLEVINTFEKVVGLDVPHKFGNRRKGDISAIYTDNKKMKELLGFVPKYNLEDMLVHSWLWYNNYKNHIKPWIISL